VGAAAAPRPPAAIGPLGVSGRRAQPLPALAGRHAPGRPLRPAALPVAAGDLPRRPLAGADRGAAAHGRPAARRRPRTVRPFLRRQFPDRFRPDPRAAGPADHPRGADRDPGRPSAQPERRLRRRRADRSRVDGVTSEVAAVPQAAAVRRLHRRQHGLRPSRLVHVRDRGGTDRRAADHVLLVLLRAGPDAEPGRAGSVRDVPQRPLLHVHERLLSPHDARHRPAPQGDLPRHDADRVPLRPAQGPASLPTPDRVDAARRGGALARRRRRRAPRAGRRVAPRARPAAQVADVARGGAGPLRAAARPRVPGSRRGGEARAHVPAGRPQDVSVQDRHGAPGPAAPLTEILKYLPGKVAQCRIFATSHEHDAALAAALERALGEAPPSIVTNV